MYEAKKDTSPSIDAREVSDHLSIYIFSIVLTLSISLSYGEYQSDQRLISQRLFFLESTSMLSGFVFSVGT